MHYFAPSISPTSDACFMIIIFQCVASTAYSKLRDSEAVDVELVDTQKYSVNPTLLICHYLM